MPLLPPKRHMKTRTLPPSSESLPGYLDASTLFPMVAHARMCGASWARLAVTLVVPEGRSGLQAE